MSECAHEQFAANVQVTRVQDGAQEPIGAFVAEITVECAACKLPFRWIGPDMGMSYDHPMVNVNRRSLLAPMEPDTAEAIHRIAGARGYMIKLGRGVKLPRPQGGVS